MLRRYSHPKAPLVGMWADQCDATSKTQSEFNACVEAAYARQQGEAALRSAGWGYIGWGVTIVGGILLLKLLLK